MPNIRAFETPALGLRPTETGVESRAATARRVGGFYDQEASSLSQLGRETESLGAFEGQKFKEAGSRIGSGIAAAGDAYVNFLDHQEISHGSATFAQLQDDLTTQWNNFAKNADPNDPSVAAKFRETVLQPALDKFTGDGFTTEKSQAWAQGHAAALQQHMFQKTSADMSTLAGIAVRKNLHDATTHMSNTAMNDPSSVPFLLESVDHSIGGVVGSSPTLSAVDAARVSAEVSTSTKAAIVKFGAIGAIQKSGDPEKTADEWIKKYPDYIDGAEAKALAGNARQQIRARNYDYEQNRRREKEVAQDKSTERTNQYLIKQDKNNLLNYVDRTLKPETDSRLSQQTFVGLLRDLRAPNADPDAVMQKAWDARLTDPGKPGSMTESDFNQFRQEVVARKTPEGAALERDRSLFFKQYAGTIAGTGYDPAMGSPKLYNAEADARRMESMLRSKGLDPHLAYDPSSEYFLGRPQRLQKWQQSMQVDLNLRAEGPAAATATRPEVPFELRGIADVSYNRSKNLWRDNTSGKIYDASGKEVGK
jgi:hypothetical protein